MQIFELSVEQRPQGRRFNLRESTGSITLSDRADMDRLPRTVPRSIAVDLRRGSSASLSRTSPTAADRLFPSDRAFCSADVIETEGGAKRVEWKRAMVDHVNPAMGHLGLDVMARHSHATIMRALFPCAKPAFALGKSARTT